MQGILGLRNEQYEIPCPAIQCKVLNHSHEVATLRNFPLGCGLMVSCAQGVSFGTWGCLHHSLGNFSYSDSSSLEVVGVQYHSAY